MSPAPCPLLPAFARPAVSIVGGGWAGTPVETRCSVSKETIQVPAGKYETMKVLEEYSIPWMNLENVRKTRWYARGIGVVKLEADFGGRARLGYELEKFERGK